MVMIDQDLHAMIWAIDARLHCTYMKDGEPADAVVSFEISRWFLEQIYEKLNELMKIKQSVKFKELVDDASAESAGADAGRCADVFDVQRQPGDSD